ncbi:MAG: prepilin-type N-terminal cleavage/methylation domain-containing protein [Epsilonproteobacteria bacterium]|nr:prepilin-type N-terminal cleavage/methylation domain-containing protein [Campylobacterota bacterium]
MYVKKPAFTIIELIFTMVIIAVLASLAIPKLMTTRDDAKMVAKKTEITNIINEILTYTLYKGKVESNMTKMSETLRRFSLAGVATMEENETKIKIGSVDCVDMKIVYIDSKYELNISAIANINGDLLCKYLQSNAKDLFQTVQLNENSVKR